jgi:hypothetical protein
VTLMAENTNAYTCRYLEENTDRLVDIGVGGMMI